MDYILREFVKEEKARKSRMLARLNRATQDSVEGSEIQVSIRGTEWGLDRRTLDFRGVEEVWVNLHSFDETEKVTVSIGILTAIEIVERAFASTPSKNLPAVKECCATLRKLWREEMSS